MTEPNNSPLKTNYVFIDYENVQPSGVAAIKEHDFRVVIFVGKKQNSISAELVQNLQPLGCKVKYINLDVSGPNALDFILTFYLGKIYANDRSAYFHIISKDTGFDALITHLRSTGVKIARHEDIKSIHPLKIAAQQDLQHKIDKILDNLEKGPKPRKRNTLENKIRTLFKEPPLSSKELHEIITKLINKKVIQDEDGKITYAS